MTFEEGDLSSDLGAPTMKQHVPYLHISVWHVLLRPPPPPPATEQVPSCYNGARTLLAFLPKGLRTHPRKGAVNRAQSQQIATVWVGGREGERERAECSDAHRC